MQENAGIATLSWVPRVLGSERAEHEREAERQGLAGYQIKEMGEGRKCRCRRNTTNITRSSYATVPRTSPLYGLDLRSEPETLVELEQARDHDRLGFSPIVTLVSSANTRSGFLFSLPVYRHGLPHGTIDERRRNLIGFVHGSLITSKMIDTIVNTNNGPEGLDIFFFAPGAGADAQPIYVHGSRLRSEPARPASQAALDARRASVARARRRRATLDDHGHGADAGRAADGGA